MTTHLMIIYISRKAKKRQILPLHYVTAHIQVNDGDDQQIWRVAGGYIESNKGWSSSLGADIRANNASP